jgi:hypothetical protein
VAGEADNAESSGGLVGWITKKAGQAWESIKLELEPVILLIQGFADQVIAFLPMDNIRNVRETVTDFPGKAASMSENLGQPDDVVNNQATLRDEILPGILETIAVTTSGETQSIQPAEWNRMEYPVEFKSPRAPTN